MHHFAGIIHLARLPQVAGCAVTASHQIPVKITLNDTIPEAQRPRIEKLVQTIVRAPEIAWLPSRFPHLVMFVEPGPAEQVEAERTSIFSSPRAEMRSTASLTALLEEKIKASLALP